MKDQVMTKFRKVWRERQQQIRDLGVLDRLFERRWGGEDETMRERAEIDLGEFDADGRRIEADAGDDEEDDD